MSFSLALYFVFRGRNLFLPVVASLFPSLPSPACSEYIFIIIFYLVSPRSGARRTNERTNERTLSAFNPEKWIFGRGKHGQGVASNVVTWMEGRDEKCAMIKETQRGEGEEEGQFISQCYTAKDEVTRIRGAKEQQRESEG